MTADINTGGRYTISVLDGVWRVMGLETTDQGADGRALLTFHRVDEPVPSATGELRGPDYEMGSLMVKAILAGGNTEEARDAVNHLRLGLEAAGRLKPPS